MQIKVLINGESSPQLIHLSHFDISATHKRLCFFQAIDTVTSRMMVEDRDFTVLNLVR